ncbi:OB-fold protein [Flavisphingomonas formosensis]|uniref:OB-fold protein n=1 Tax=Flavisphingomonas formosensis TaxID=861534 RepID=UPI0012F87E0E|nr:hypothetical protein [Sphingomonas formosensis]
MKSRKTKEEPIGGKLIAGLVVLGLLLAVSVGLLLVRGGGRDIGAGAQPTSAAELAAPLQTVSSATLGQAYAADEMAANKAYGGRRLSVTGVVQGATLDFTNEPVISLNGASDSAHVQVSLDKSYADKVRALKSGMIVTVACEKVVLIMGAPMLDDCTLGEG